MIQDTNQVYDVYTEAIKKAKADAEKAAKKINKYEKKTKKETDEDDEDAYTTIKKREHKGVFKPYDYQFNWSLMKWVSLADLKRANLVLADWKIEVRVRDAALCVCLWLSTCDITHEVPVEHILPPTIGLLM